jgi:ATP-binding cassette subfamily C protein
LILTTLLNYWRLRLERISQQLQGQNAGRVLQILNGIAKLRAAGAEKRAFTLWAASYSKQKAIAFRIRNLSGALAAFDAGYIVVCFLSLYAAAAFISDDMAPGAFLAFGTAFSQFMGATLAMTTAVTASLNAIALYERVRPILDTPPEVGALQKPPGKLAGSIEINQLSFRYHAAGPLILDDISMKIEPGQFIALVGASGSGKSTLLRLLLGFEKAGSGGIYYDGRSLSSLDAAALRRQFGVVLQSARLMPGNILTNITGATALSLDDAWDAARMAGLEDDIKAMPMGMYTLLAEGAATFSGGQKQRLMIARAIVRKPAILLFDEATSALDNRTQAIVAKNLESLKATRIVVAHRLSTIIKADKIFVIDAGRIVETGNYAELMQRNGRFAGLARRQLA